MVSEKTRDCRSWTALEETWRTKTTKSASSVETLFEQGELTIIEDHKLQSQRSFLPVHYQVQLEDQGSSKPISPPDSVSTAVSSSTVGLKVALTSFTSLLELLIGLTTALMTSAALLPVTSKVTNSSSYFLIATLEPLLNAFPNASTTCRAMVGCTRMRTRRSGRGCPFCGVVKGSGCQMKFAGPMRPRG